MEVGGERHAPSALSPANKPGTHCIGGWMGPRAGLDVYGKFRARRYSTPEPSNSQRVAIPTTPSRASGNLQTSRLTNWLTDLAAL